MSPILYLIPTPLGAPDTPCLLPHEQAQITGLTDFVVEAEKTARAHLKHLGVTTPIRELNLQRFQKFGQSFQIGVFIEGLQVQLADGHPQRSGLSCGCRSRREFGGIGAPTRL